MAQTLKYDPYHNSALSGFLMRRALLAPSYIGHLFFWSLKAVRKTNASSFFVSHVLLLKKRSFDQDRLRTN
eukprot:COSAG06_NODE_13325_length_1268_cov_1.544055_1_plen_70_part_10